MAVRASARVVAFLMVLSAFGAPSWAAEPGAQATEPAATSKPQSVLQIVSPAVAARAIEKGAQAIDARSAAKYFAGHVTGAVHLADSTLRCSQGGVPVRMRDAEDLSKLFSQAGVSFDRPVIVYSDGEDPLAATLTAYALVGLGHPSVRILDGGFEAWRGAHATTQDFLPAPSSTTGPSRAGELRRASLDEVRSLVFDDQITFVDARPASQYRGEGRLWRRNGHIPGAISVDWKTLMDKDNTSKFRARKEIEKLLTDAGVDKTDDIVVYCGTGREATLLYLYLSQILEYPSVRLFEGSWTEYSADDSLPVATGTDPYTPIYRDGDVMISGQPGEELLKQLADEGVAVVINCRTPDEASSVDYAESKLVQSLGMAYVELPLGGKFGYQPEDSARLSAALRLHSGRRILIHCASGGRATSLWMSHLVRSEGLTVDQAMDRARRAGMLRTSALERLIGPTPSGGR